MSDSQSNMAGTAMLVVFVMASSVTCGASRATGDASTQTTSQARNDLTIWDAINKPHSDGVFLQCRGGAGFEFRSIGCRPTSRGDIVAVALVFAANDKAAGTTNQNLEPGTCAPTDRPLGASEPREVHFVTAAFSQPSIGPIDVTPNAAEHMPDVRSIADYLRNPHHYWTFNASNTKQGYFDSWVHQYWKDFSVTPPRPQSSDDKLSGKPVRWLVRVRLTGGLGGTTREVSVNADGHLHAFSSMGNVECSAELFGPEIQSIEAAVARSQPDKWLKSYVLKSNPDGCCDQYQQTVRVEQEDAQGRRSSHETYWFNGNAGSVPEGVSALLNLIVSEKKVCSALYF